MAGRKRAYSDVSGDEMETIERVKCLTVDIALKPIAKTVDPNDWPCFVLEDACAYNQDGKTIANMLHAELRGPFIVRGKLIVDKDQRKCLVHKTFEGQYVEIGNCQGFSIGYEPTVLWASGKAGWFEIKPSAEYKPIHDKMIEGISLYFMVTVLFEDLMHKKSSRKNHKTLSAEQVLLRYAISEGTGLVKAEVENRFKEHGEFLLSQMGKPSDGGGVNWKTTNFYKWVEAQCPDVAHLMKTKRGEKETNGSVHEREPGEVTVRNVFVSEPSSSRTIAYISRPKPVKPAKQRMEEPSIQPLDFEDDKPGDSESASPTVLILRVLNKLVTNEKSRNRLTLTRVGTELYYDYSFSNYQLKEWIVKAHAKPVFAALTDDWKDSPFYKLLKDFLAQKEPKNELYEEAKQYVFKARVKKDPSAGAGKAKNASQQSTKAEKKPSRETSTDSLEPVPTTGKSLPHTMSGRRSGKEAGLRLATSPIKRPHSPDASGDEGFEAIRRRQRKRRRPSLEPELGSPNEVEEPDILDGDANDEGKPDTIMGIVAESLPSVTPTGPNGMWTCHKEGCDFVVRAADEEEGKQKIQEHLGEHAELIARETLVLQEARPHLPVSHLLDKLRKLGEEAKKTDEKARPTINGIIVPRPIKRHGMYT